MEEARDLFEEMGEEDRNIVTWTSMVACQCRRGDIEEGTLCSRECLRRISSLGQL